MVQSEKLDLILKALYKQKNSRVYISLKEICRTQDIPLDGNDLEKSIELVRLTKRLEADDLIKASITYADCSALLTSYGISYCEESSYSYSGQSLITNQYNISISNSPGTNLIHQSSNVSISKNSEGTNKVKRQDDIQDVDYKNKKWQFTTRWVFLIISIVSLIIGILTLYYNLFIKK